MQVNGFLHFLMMGFPYCAVQHTPYLSILGVKQAVLTKVGFAVGSEGFAAIQLW